MAAASAEENAIAQQLRDRGWKVTTNDGGFIVGLDLSGPPAATDADLAVLADLKHVEAIEFDGPDITDAAIDQVLHMKDLK